MNKLNDTQLVLMAAGAGRDDLSLLPLAKTGCSPTRSIASLLRSGLIAERETPVALQAHRTDGDIGYGLFVTQAGMSALGLGDGSADGGRLVDAVSPAARGTKASAVLDLLRRESGASINELIALTGWLPHTTRAALTGLRKKGHDIVRFNIDGGTRYRVAD